MSRTVSPGHRLGASAEAWLAFHRCTGLVGHVRPRGGTVTCVTLQTKRAAPLKGSDLKAGRRASDGPLAGRNMYIVKKKKRVRGPPNKARRRGKRHKTTYNTSTIKTPYHIGPKATLAHSPHAPQPDTLGLQYKQRRIPTPDVMPGRLHRPISTSVQCPGYGLCPWSYLRVAQSANQP